MINNGEKYHNKCGSCEHLNINSPCGYKYSCSKRYGYHDLNEVKCSSYRFDKYRDYNELERIESRQCYITTILCEILGLEDNCEILNAMREFRRVVLQRNLRYLGLLMDYDDVGPKIAECLRNDENKLWIAKELLKHYISPIINCIKEQNYDSAVIMYYNMTNLLMENYQIVGDNEMIEDYDQSMGGHGRVYKKVNE